MRHLVQSTQLVFDNVMYRKPGYNHRWSFIVCERRVCATVNLSRGRCIIVSVTRHARANQFIVVINNIIVTLHVVKVIRAN